jgi:hypothetical protein
MTVEVTKFVPVSIRGNVETWAVEHAARGIGCHGHQFVLVLRHCPQVNAIAAPQSKVM